MSMLQQILDQMFVDPEILEALDEEQKQILFIKMREEQVKRWKAYEEKYEQEHPPQKKSSEKARSVQWLSGADGEVWVWVMGEHKDDLSLEDMIEKRALEEARQIAEKEMLDSIQLSGLDSDSQDLYPSEDESTLKQQLSRMGVQGSYNDDSTQNFYFESVDGGEPSDRILRDALRTVTPRSNNVSDDDYRMAAYDSRGDTIQNSKPLNVSYSSSEGMSEFLKNVEKKTPAIPERTSGLKPFNVEKESVDEVSEKKMFGQVQPSGTASKFVSLLTANNRVPKVAGEKPPFLTPKPKLTSVQTSKTPCTQPSTSWADKSSTLPARLDLSSVNALSQVKLRSNANNRVLPPVSDELSKRQSEIYEMIREKRQKILKEAEREAERANHDWEEQERRAREAEAQIRRIAQKAREQHRQQSLRTSTSILPALKDTKAVSLREAIKNLPRPPKPKSRQAIVDWFRVEELPRGTGLDPKTNLPAPWFHGIISRDQADQLLQNKPSGSFLVRISERIWGYTVSYVVGEGLTKHFLIERIPEGYQFLGTNQVVHRHLFDLITYHETAPITVKGNEILKWAVGQVSSPPDYAELMVDLKVFSKQRSNTLPASFYRRV